jgi:hypothetical protein
LVSSFQAQGATVVAGAWVVGVAPVVGVEESSLELFISRTTITTMATTARSTPMIVPKLEPLLWVT